MLVVGATTGFAMPRTRNRLDLMRIAALRRPARAPGRARGQSLVEFALVLIPLLLLILGVIQFGLIFNSYVTMTNAAREGARTGTIYVHDRSRSKADNDTARNTAIRTSVLASMNLLAKTSPQFADGDLTITYAIPAGVTDTETRTGQTVTVRATYHQDLITATFSLALRPPEDTRTVDVAGLGETTNRIIDQYDLPIPETYPRGSSVTPAHPSPSPSPAP